MTSRADLVGRLVVVGVITFTAAFVAATFAQRPLVLQDFAYYHRGARLWLDGVNPYAMRPHTAAWPFGDRLFYPLPALMILSPLAWLSQPVAVAIFVGVPTGALAWRLSRDALWPLLTLASPQFAMAVVLGQWSPWMLLALSVPWLGWILPAKPTLGAAMFVARPSYHGALTGLAILALSFMLWPFWPVGWLANVRALPGHPAPLFTMLGGLCWLAVVRWYRPDGRLVLAMAALPQVLFFADQLPLLAVAESKRELVALVVCGWVAAIVWGWRHYHAPGYVEAAEPYVLLGCYLPALWLVLRRPAVTSGAA